MQAVRDAAQALQAEPEAQVAATIAADIAYCLELIESRVTELPELLGAKQSDGWTV